MSFCQFQWQSNVPPSTVSNCPRTHASIGLQISTPSCSLARTLRGSQRVAKYWEWVPVVLFVKWIDIESTNLNAKTQYCTLKILNNEIVTDGGTLISNYPVRCWQNECQIREEIWRPSAESNFTKGIFCSHYKCVCALFLIYVLLYSVGCIFFFILFCYLLQDLSRWMKILKKTSR